MPGGVQTCNAAGTEFGACDGEVVPQLEQCDTPADENCSGDVTCGVVVAGGETSADVGDGGGGVEHCLRRVSRSPHFSADQVLISSHISGRDAVFLWSGSTISGRRL